MMEADCTRCGETFIPASPEMIDLIHGQTEAGEHCGGIGIVTGAWYRDGEMVSDMVFPPLTAQEKHGEEVPDCEDPDCEFHHPEVIEG